MQDIWDTFLADNNNSIMVNKKLNNHTFLVMLDTFLLYNLKIFMVKLMVKLPNNVQKEATSEESNNQKKSSTTLQQSQLTKIPIKLKTKNSMKEK